MTAVGVVMAMGAMRMMMVMTMEHLNSLRYNLLRYILPHFSAIASSHL
jgi:hypothetical protein